MCSNTTLSLMKTSSIHPSVIFNQSDEVMKFNVPAKQKQKLQQTLPEPLHAAVQMFVLLISRLLNLFSGSIIRFFVTNATSAVMSTLTKQPAFQLSHMVFLSDILSRTLRHHVACSQF